MHPFGEVADRPEDPFPERILQHLSRAWHGECRPVDFGFWNCLVSGRQLLLEFDLLGSGIGVQVDVTSIVVSMLTGKNVSTDIQPMSLSHVAPMSEDSVFSLHSRICEMRGTYW